MRAFDGANAMFEIGGGMLQVSNCWRLWRDKRVAGVNVSVTAFFTAWGAWNLAFYPAVGAPLSAVGAGLIAVANGVWVALALRYRRGAR